jgi:hypothetical protein
MPIVGSSCDSQCSPEHLISAIYTLWSWWLSDRHVVSDLQWSMILHSFWCHCYCLFDGWKPILPHILSAQKCCCLIEDWKPLCLKYFLQQNGMVYWYSVVFIAKSWILSFYWWNLHPHLYQSLLSHLPLHLLEYQNSLSMKARPADSGSFAWIPKLLMHKT